MKLALLVTTLLVLLLTSMCVAAALHDNNEDDGGYRKMLIKRYLSDSSPEKSPPMPPRQGLGRAHSGTVVQRAREEVERKEREHSDAGHYHHSSQHFRQIQSKDRRAVRIAESQPATGPSRRLDEQSRSKWPMDRKALRLVQRHTGEIIDLSDDLTDHLVDEKTDDEETESDPWSNEGHESAWRYNDVSMTIKRGKNSEVAEEESSEEQHKRRLKKLKDVYESTSTTPYSSSRKPSMTHATPSPAWGKSDHALFKHRPPLSHSDTSDKLLNPWGQQMRSSTSGNPSAHNPATHESWETSPHTKAPLRPLMSSMDDQIQGDARKQQRGRQRKRIGGEGGEIKRATFLDILNAKEPFYQRRKATAEEKHLVSSAKSAQELIDLATKIEGTFVLPKAQKEILEKARRLKEFTKARDSRLSRSEIRTAKRREKKRKLFEDLELSNEPRSYRNLKPKRLSDLCVRLQYVVNDIEAINTGKVDLELKEGEKPRYLDFWTQEDLDWWKGYVDFRKRAAAPHRPSATLVEKIDNFFSNGMGKGWQPTKPPAGSKSRKRGNFRPLGASDEAPLRKTASTGAIPESVTPSVQALIL